MTDYEARLRELEVRDAERRKRIEDLERLALQLLQQLGQQAQAPYAT